MTDTTELARQRLASTRADRGRGAQLPCDSWSGDHWVTHTESARIGARQPEHRAGPVPSSSSLASPKSTKRSSGRRTPPRCGDALAWTSAARSSCASPPACVANDERLTMIGTLAGGMTKAAALAAADKCADFFEYYAGWTDKLNGAVVPMYPGRALDYTTLEPYGVVLAMINWNGPLTSTGREGRRGVGGRQLGGRQVTGAGPVRARAVRRDLPRGRASRRCAQPPQRWPRRRRDAGRAIRAIDKISFTGSGSTAQKVMSAAAAEPHAGRPRTGRQVGQPGVRGRRPGCGRARWRRCTGSCVAPGRAVCSRLGCWYRSPSTRTSSSASSPGCAPPGSATRCSTSEPTWVRVIGQSAVTASSA